MPFGIDVELIQLYAWGLLGLLCCCAALSALLIAWRGKVAGMLIGGVVLGGGLTVLIGMLVLVPRYWWVSVPPICLGVQTVRMWRRPPDKAAMSVSLRTAGLLVLAIGLMLAGFAQVRRQVARERTLLTQLRELDADVVTAFDGVVKVVLLRGKSDTRVQQAAPLLAQLSSLRELGLETSQVEPATLQFLAELPQLQLLGLQSCQQVDDQALPHIAKLTRLRRLDLMQTGVGDGRLQSLQTLKRLEQLYLRGSQVTEAGVEQLRAKLPQAEISF